MTNIRNLYYIDINYIEETIKEIDKLIIQGFTDSDERSVKMSQKYLLQKLKAQLKPITPLIKDAFDNGRNYEDVYGFAEDEAKFLIDKEEYINNKQF